METFALVLTDVQGSTQLWAEEPDAMYAAMRRHHEIVHGAVTEHDGFRPPDQGEGDAVFAAFANPVAAVSAVAQVQRQLHAESWPTSRPLRVRVGIHVGPVRVRDGNLFGDPVNRCARIRGLASGGQTLLSAAVFELVRDQLPLGLGLQDLGEHRMKDLTRPERLHQLEVDGLPREFPPLLSLNRAKHNLPVQLSSFVGREEEVAELRKLLQAHRLVTITGFGGMGKTRLALQLAAELADGAGDGVWFVDLAAVTDPNRVPAEIAAVLSMPDTSEGSAQTLLRTLADKNLLLVLDNVEQVLGCAQFIGDLLAAAPAVHVLVTSREPLRLRGEHQYPVQPMPVPEADATPDLVANSDAGRLFLDRAAAVRPDFAVTEANAAALAALCVRLDGLPLALELAAARMKMVTVDSLLQRLQAGQQIHTGGMRDMPERHRTLRATIAWSVDALNDGERELLTAMSILPAHAGFELIEGLARPDLDALEILESLVDKSLVSTSEAGDGLRFGLLISIRNYLNEYLTDGNRRALRDRYADHVQQQLAARADRWESWDSLGRYVATNLTHIRTAINHRRATGDKLAELALVRDLDDHLVHLGHHREYLEMVERVIRATTAPRDLSRLQVTASIAWTQLGRADQASMSARLSLDLAREAGDPTMTAYCIVFVLPSATEAELAALNEEFDRLLPSIPEPERTGMSTERDNCLAELLRFRDPKRAEDAARRLLGSDLHPAGQVVLARILLARGQAAEALEVLNDSRGFAGLTPRLFELRAIELRALAAYLLDDLHGARNEAREAIDGHQDLGSHPHFAARVLAMVERREHGDAAALEVLDAVVSPVTDDSALDIAVVLWPRAVLLHALGRTEQASADLDRAQQIAVEQPFSRGLLDLLGCLVERAAQILGADPTAAARMLGCVDAHRANWILPFEMDAEADRLRTALLPAHAHDMAAARHLDPFAEGHRSRPKAERTQPL